MIGERLIDLRKDAGLTQDELASILKVNKHSISSYERDKNEPSDAIKIEISKYFNVSIDYLLGITDFMSKLSENKKYIELPKDFPDSAKQALLDYAEFLTKKYKTQ